MKLVIVEGIPGSGKSSTARFISLQLERNGVQTELFHESTFQHPILLEEVINNSEQWQASYLSKWKKFISNNADMQTVCVFESVLFQSPIINLLHLDTDQSEIIRFIDEILSSLSTVDCSLVYLYQNDPGVGINRMMATRGGESWLENTYEKYKHFPYYKNRGHSGKELHLKFLDDYSKIAGHLFSECRINSIGIDNSNWEWDQDYGTIMSFLGHDICPDPEISLEELEVFIGFFRSDELGLTIQIQMGKDGLYIFGDQKLKPRDKNKFYLDNISMSLEFLFNGESNPFEVLIYEKDIVGNRNDIGSKFIKITN
ncbi:hypothetical protein ACFO9Q_01445 [Paenibacillus sp. GCM10023252]|uniref:hypothetical protein n=1 Tax=Paenibacillus sp. GCM10023252 TaxID=3252649 RepID=UPI0036144B7B